MKALIFAAPLVLAATGAMAADVYMEQAPEPAPIVEAPVMSWTGGYIGIQAGGAFGDTGVLSITPFTPPLAAAFGPNFSGGFDSGFSGGAHLGYDWQMGNFVIGGILDVSAVDLEDRQQAFSATPATYSISRELDYLVTLRARMGVLATDRALLYATGGLAYGQVDFRYRQPGSGAAFTTAGGQDSDFGYTVGAGAEARVTERFSIGFEYLYTNLGGNDFRANLVNGPFGGPAGAPGSNPGGTTLRGSDNDFDFHTVQVKFSYRF